MYRITRPCKDAQCPAMGIEPEPCSNVAPILEKKIQMQPFFWHWQPLPFPPLPFTQGCPCANWGAARLEKCTSIPHNLAHPPHGQATKCAGKTVQKKDKCNWRHQRNTFQHQFSGKCNIYTSTHAYTHIPIYLISKPSASPGSHCLVQISRFLIREDYQIANCLVSRQLKLTFLRFEAGAAILDWKNKWNKLAKLRRHASRVHFAKIHLG